MTASIKHDLHYNVTTAKPRIDPRRRGRKTEGGGASERSKRDRSWKVTAAKAALIHDGHNRRREEAGSEEGLTAGEGSTETEEQGARGGARAGMTMRQMIQGPRSFCLSGIRKQTKSSRKRQREREKAERGRSEAADAVIDISV